MADKQISILLVAKNLASGTLGKVTKDVSTLGKVSNRAGQGLRSLGTNLAKIGALAAVGLGVAVKGGIQSLADLESSVTSVQGALSQMGLAGKVTGAQVATWANEIESNVQAAFDDKDITRAAGTLVRYGKVTGKNLKPAMQVMTDLAAKTGDVDGAATLLAKALADPAKAAGKLTRAGVTLTAAEQKQITALVKAGKKTEAQAVLLRALERTTKGAASAMNGPMVDALKETEDAGEDAQRALATGFLPVIKRVAEWLQTKLRDPKVIADIRSLGDSLAGIFDKGVDFVTKIPWDSVRSAMSAVGTGAKMALDAFMAMPSWVQAAVVGGWGLNKLTGGALGDIAGELGKGLIKGVLGMNAGVVNINAGIVNGGGGGLPGKGGGGVPGVPAAAAGGLLAPGLATLGAGIGGILAMYALPAIVAEMNKDQPVVTGAVGANGTKLTGTQVDQMSGLMPSFKGLIEGTGGKITTAVKGLNNPLANIDGGLQQTSIDTRSEGIATRRGLEGTRAAALESARAIRAKKWDVDVKVNVPVTVRTTVSVRDHAIAVRANAAYQGSGKVKGIGTG